MTIGRTSFSWTSLPPDDFGRIRRSVGTEAENTERELTVPPSCPDLYEPLATELSRQLGRAAQPARRSVRFAARDGFTDRDDIRSSCRFATRSSEESSVADGKASRPIAILLPEGSNLVAWFRAFLCELHESDSTRVPHAPPRLSQTVGLGTTPQERVLADSNF